MKKISRKELRKSIRKSCKEARQWCRLDFGRTYKIMIDTDNADVWCDVFLDSNSYNVYHSDTVMSLSCSDQLCITVADAENAYLDDAISELVKAGWSIE